MAWDGQFAIDTGDGDGEFIIDDSGNFGVGEDCCCGSCLCAGCSYLESSSIVAEFKMERVDYTTGGSCAFTVCEGQWFHEAEYFFDQCNDTYTSWSTILAGDYSSYSDFSAPCNKSWSFSAGGAGIRQIRKDCATGKWIFGIHFLDVRCTPGSIRFGNLGTGCTSGSDNGTARCIVGDPCYADVTVDSYLQYYSNGAP